ncbi:hypothetical protein DXG01_002742 [Tephrocybe rancida]|nr:hypothetical protein DXG01_002742 [Tephrocybe rancida]
MAPLDAIPRQPPQTTTPGCDVVESNLDQVSVGKNFFCAIPVPSLVVDHISYCNTFDPIRFSLHTTPYKSLTLVLFPSSPLLLSFTAMPSYPPTGPKKTTPPTPHIVECDVHGPLQKGITRKDGVIDLICHLPSYAGHLIDACNEARKEGTPRHVAMFMSSLPDVTLDPIWLGHLADQNRLTEAIEGVLGVADRSFVDTSTVFKSWCILGDGISKITKDRRRAQAARNRAEAQAKRNEAHRHRLDSDGDIEMSTNSPVRVSKRKANGNVSTVSPLMLLHSTSFEPGNVAALALVKEVGTTLERTGTVTVEELTTYSDILATTAVHQVFELDLAHQIYKCVLQCREAVLRELAVWSMENTSVQLSHLNVASGSQVPAAADKDMNPDLSDGTGAAGPSDEVAVAIASAL